MANKNNNHFQIPIPLIVFAYFVHPVVGVILTILRLVSASGSSSSSASRQPTAAQMRSQYEAERQAVLNREKNEAMQAELNRQRQQANARNEEALRKQQGQNTGTYSNPYYQEQMAKDARKRADELEIELVTRSFGEEYMSMLARPKWGYGSNVNPCVDCRTLMLREAGKLMEEIGADSFNIMAMIVGL